MSGADLGVYALLIFVPISVVAYFVHVDDRFVFTFSILAVIPLAKLIGESTGELEKISGPTVGALLNASFGNAAELIIALSALSAGLLDLVKASITGSILGNTLLIFGMSIFLGGAKFKEQKFNKEIAGLQSSMLFIALIGLAIPTLFFQATSKTPETETLSDAVAVLLMAVYVLSLVFTLVSHKHLFSTTHEQPAVRPSRAGWSKGKSVLVLLVSMALVAALSEILVASFESAVANVHLSEMFVGAVIVAVIGNAAEHSSAVNFAMENRLDLSIGIAANSSTQIALFVVPVLVFAGLVLGSPITLVFTIFELIALFAASAIVNMISFDGQSNWFEGVQLLTVYMILVAAFYFL
jgi:Ca2+:H+ antiporter